MSQKPQGFLKPTATFFCYVAGMIEVAKFPYLTARKGSSNLYYKREVPPELRADGRPSQIWRSLRTGDQKKAQAAYGAQHAEVEALFAQWRKEESQPGAGRASPKSASEAPPTTLPLTPALLADLLTPIIAGLFTPEQARHHLQLIRQHLLFPDGVRLMDRPVRYRGGPQQLFRRAESASFFGREIGLMYVHAHLGYAEALAVLGEADALWEALLVVNPISVTDRLANGSLRQRNAYFSSSDAAFTDRYQAETAWEDVKAGRIAVDGGWRIYSSGPGLYASVLLRQALGRRRYFGARSATPQLPMWLGTVTLESRARDAASAQHPVSGRLNWRHE